MLFYLSTFLLFIYFKIARVHSKEEKRTTIVTIEHILVGISALLIYLYGFSFYPWYLVLIFSFIFFILSALGVTAIQLGIFIDGKPQFGISKVYKFIPLLTVSIVLLSLYMFITYLSI